MIRWFDALLVCAVVASAMATFMVKHDARRVADEIAALERRAEVERAAIELQEADWSLLSQPDRLQELVEAHEGELALRPVRAEQFVRIDRLDETLDALSPTSVEDALAALSAGGDGASDGIDDVRTGAVE